MGYFRRCINSLRSPARLTSCLILTVAVLSTGVALGTASPASAAPEITICLKNSPSFCVDVKDSRDVSGQPVWLYSRSSANDYHWFEVPVPCGSMSCLPGCDNTSCIAFEDVQKPSLCLAASASEGVDLIPCQLPFGGTARAAWINSPATKIRNYFWIGANLGVNGPLANKNALFVTPSSGGPIWNQWTGE
jgi:hypothetical protein